jgi:pyruvate,orthophosphate dikinase
MFMQGERLKIMREMILSEGDEALVEALTKLEPMQCEDFEGLKIMRDLVWDRAF